MTPPPARASQEPPSSRDQVLPQQLLEALTRHEATLVEDSAGCDQVAGVDGVLVTVGRVQEPRLRRRMVEADELRVGPHREAEVEQDLSQHAKGRLKHGQAPLSV